MSPVHEEMAAGRWMSYPLVEQLANVGSEIERAMSWAAKGNGDYSRRAFERGLELLDLTIADPKHRHRLRELTRLREVLVDYFWCDNEYGSTPESWHSYFHPYGVAVSIRKHGV
jgi:hypothetical protein